MLHLTPDDEESVAEHSVIRAAQIDREHIQLKEMQKKQLRALLRIDNSLLKQSRVPGQLVFRNTSKQYLRDPRARANPDYLMSEAGEVLTARKYLRSIGLDSALAGEWKNDLVNMRAPRDDLEEDELEWRAGPIQPTEQDTLSRLGKRPANSLIGEATDNGDNLGIKIHFINHIGSCDHVMFANSHPLKTGDFSTPQLNAAQQIFNRRRPQPGPRHENPRPIPPVTGDEGAMVRLRVGSHGAAQIRNYPEPPPVACESVIAPLASPPRAAWSRCRRGRSTSTPTRTSRP